MVIHIQTNLILLKSIQDLLMRVRSINSLVLIIADWITYYLLSKSPIEGTWWDRILIINNIITYHHVK